LAPHRGSVQELFLACGATSAFTIVSPGTTGFSQNAILVSSWDETSQTFSAWTEAVPSPGAGQTRCFLSGFDRVVDGGAPDPGPHVGLLWSDSLHTDCELPSDGVLSMAIVAVPPG
jgi:hypothetical protein